MASMWLPRSPKLKVIWAIVRLDPVLVVNGFVLGKWPTKQFGHHDPMKILSLTVPINTPLNISG